MNKNQEIALKGQNPLGKFKWAKRIIKRPTWKIVQVIVQMESPDGEKQLLTLTNQTSQYLGQAGLGSVGKVRHLWVLRINAWVLKVTYI